MKTFWAFLLLIGFLFIACLFTGCAQMGTRQTDTNTTTRYEIDKKGATNAITTEIRETTTRAKGTAVISGKTALEGFTANQDGKKQGLEIKKTSQQTDGLAQAAESLKALRDIAMMLNGIPPPQSAPTQSSAPPSSPPAGKKWVLAPKDEPSTPQPEQE